MIIDVQYVCRVCSTKKIIVCDVVHDLNYADVIFYHPYCIPYQVKFGTSTEIQYFSVFAVYVTNTFSTYLDIFCA